MDLKDIDPQSRVLNYCWSNKSNHHHLIITGNSDSVRFIIIDIRSACVTTYEVDWCCFYYFLKSIQKESLFLWGSDQAIACKTARASDSWFERKCYVWFVFPDSLSEMKLVWAGSCEPLYRQNVNKKIKYISRSQRKVHVVSIRNKL